MGERTWTRTLSQVEVFGAVYQALKTRGDAPPIGGDSLIGLRATYDQAGQAIYEFWSEKPKKPFRWPWSRPRPAGGTG